MRAWRWGDGAKAEASLWIECKKGPIERSTTVLVLMEGNGHGNRKCDMLGEGRYGANELTVKRPRLTVPTNLERAMMGRDILDDLV